MRKVEPKAGTAAVAKRRLLWCAAYDRAIYAGMRDMQAFSQAWKYLDWGRHHG